MVDATNPPVAELWRHEYDALVEGVGIADLSERSRVEISGDDRLSFLHNLSTNEIRKLAPGAGCEVFLLNVQGKIISHGLVFSGPESLVYNTTPGEAERVVKHLDHYLIREKVELRDRTSDWGELLVSGPKAATLLEPLVNSALPTAPLSSQAATIGFQAAQNEPRIDVWIRRVDLVGDGYLIDCQMADLETLTAGLLAAGAVAVGKHALDAARIEQGTPLFGQDVSEKNLPQEVGRDRQAISFIKGCYLGQETVARIDALGRVNRVLRGVKFAGNKPIQSDAQLTVDGQVVAEVTSATWSPRLGAPLALAYVRRGHEAAGTELQSDFGAAHVVDLPLG